jgi:hypothetical protein
VTRYGFDSSPQQALAAKPSVLGLAHAYRHFALILLEVWVHGKYWTIIIILIIIRILTKESNSPEPELDEDAKRART